MTAIAFDPTAWEHVAAAALSDVIGRVGAMEGGIRRLCGSRLAGPAHTIATGVGDSSTVHRGLEHAAHGSVVVIDAQGGTARAVWGYVLTIAAMERGVVGAVIDGAVRDLDEIAAAGFTVYARAAQALEAVAQTAAREEEWIERIRAGVTTARILGLD